MAKWTGKSRGGHLGHEIFIVTIKHLGVGFAYVLLKLVAFYFFLFAKKENLKFFYTEVLSYSKRRAYAAIYQNFCKLGEVLVDKSAVMCGAKTSFTFEFEGEEYIRQMIAGGKGGLLLGAHMGNWEVGGQLLDRIDTKVNVVMYEAEEKKIKELLDKEFVEKNLNIIAIKEGGDYLLRIIKAFKQNELVVMHGDRFVHEEGTLLMDFFGRKARFSFTPFHLASKYGVPVSFVYTLKDTKKHYHFYAAEPKIYPFPRGLKLREPAFRTMLTDYISSLEKIIKKYPNQWFNHYSFWEEEK